MFPAKWNFVPLDVPLNHAVGGLQGYGQRMGDCRGEITGFGDGDEHGQPAATGGSEKDAAFQAGAD